jgi:3-methyladenine DNA glycosylase/8-oxoguanine DNA glycosylase
LPTEPPEAGQTFEVPPVDLRRTLRALPRSRHDPTTRFTADGFWRATHTVDGPATLHIRTRQPGPVTDVAAEAWGPGAEAVLARVPAMVGAADRPEDFVAHHPVVAEEQRRQPGRRLPATGTLVEVLVPTILEQKVTGLEAWQAFRALVWRHGATAPGPGPVRLPPTADRLAALGYADFHPLGVERRRAEVILRVSRRATRLEALTASSPAAARRALEQIPGLGPWTSTSTTLLAFGDPDAVVVGDYHFPDLVTHALTGRRRGSDAEMLDLLAPYVGQRARAQGFLVPLGRMPRRAPRSAPRRFADH